MAWIRANPTTVLISSWSVSGGTTIISWDTGSTQVGTVLRSDGSQTTKLVEGPSGSSLKQKIQLGTKSLFELKRKDNGALLASVTVEGKEKMGLPSGTLNEVNQRGPTYQGITNLRVFPGPDSVRITFRTRQPAVPFITIKKEDTDALAGSAFPFLRGPSQTHDYAFPLAQATYFKFHILAPATAGAAAEQTGLFRTGSRSAEVFFDRIYVNTDGDPGPFLGAGDFNFEMGAGSIDGGEPLGRTYFSDEISGGEYRSMNLTVPVPVAPERLWVQVNAREADTFLLTSFHGDSLKFAPEGSVWIHEETATSDDEVAIVTKWFDLSGPLPAEIPFTLDTGPHHIIFSLECRLRVAITPGALLQPQITRSAKPIIPPKAFATMVVGDRVAVTGRTSHILHLAPDGGLYHADAAKRPSEERGTIRERWVRLACGLHGPVTVVATNEYLHLLMAGDHGEVLHRALSPDTSDLAARDEKWNSLGGSSFEWPLALAMSAAGMDLFALDSDGTVLHNAFIGNDAGEWVAIGEGMADSLSAFTTQAGEVGIIARGRSGDIVHRRWVRDAGRTGQPQWHTLGSAPPGKLSVEAIDDVVLFAVIAEDEVVHTATWRHYTEPSSHLEWQRLGTIDALLNSRFSLIPLLDDRKTLDGSRDAPH